MEVMLLTKLIHPLIAEDIDKLGCVMCYYVVIFFSYEFFF